MRLRALLGSMLLITACSEPTRVPPPSGAVDATARADAADAGATSADDAAPVPDDAAPAPDDASLDASVAVDSGAAPDATASLDASAAPDARPGPGATTPCTTWSPEVVYPPPGADAGTNIESGSANAIAFDPAGHAHVAFSSSDGLRYATNGSGAWQFEVIPSPRPITEVSVVLDAAQTPHVLFYQEQDFNLHHAVRTGANAWAIEPADATRFAGENFSAAYDSQGTLQIAYLQSSGEELRAGRRTANGWVSERVDASAPGLIFPRILPAANGSLDIVWSNYREGLLISSNASGAWVRSFIQRGTDVGGWNGAARDPSGAIHVSYRRGGTGMGELAYATNASGAWVTTGLDADRNPGYGTSLVADGAGGVHIAYQVGGVSELRYRSNAGGGGFVGGRVDGSGGLADATGIAFDGMGRPAISYRGSRRTFNVAWCR